MTTLSSGAVDVQCSSVDEDKAAHKRGSGHRWHVTEWRSCAEPGLSELSELSEVCRSLSEVCRRLCRRTVVRVCRSLCRTLSGLSEHLGQSICSSYVGLSELCRNCRTVGLSDCRMSVGRLSGPCRTAVLPPVGPLPSLSHYSWWVLSGTDRLVVFRRARNKGGMMRTTGKSPASCAGG